jgi:hypothetical protein
MTEDFCLLTRRFCFLSTVPPPWKLIHVRGENIGVERAGEWATHLYGIEIIEMTTSLQTVSGRCDRHCR